MLVKQNFAIPFARFYVLVKLIYKKMINLSKN
ncbi:hypothetical protein EDF66_103374 [Sphingobacterium sp. JUb20]|nr:hypothetical protein [Sphingobacterium sp. JUb21]TCR08822.1 hypothetical protein EDF66_103374 [Sphingobacterium sp. JUb20]